MQAKDVMTHNVITVNPETTVENIAKVLLDNRISAVPVVTQDQQILGIVSEGDLMRRPEIDTERSRSWWLDFVRGSQENAADYIKTHGLAAEQIMTKQITTVEEHTPLGEIAQLLEKKHIKRVPVVKSNKLVGIVSRANILQSLATHKSTLSQPTSIDDQNLRSKILTSIREKRWVTHGTPNVIVSNGDVELWGWVESEQEREALKLAIKSIPGVKSLESHLSSAPTYL